MTIVRLLTSIIDTLYIKPLERIISRDTFGYCICGATNMALDTVWYFLIYHYLVCEQFIELPFVVVSPHIASLIVVFPITFFTGFWLNRNVAFRTTEVRSLPQILRYGLSVVGSIALNYVCMKKLQLIIVFHSYFFHQFFNPNIKIASHYITNIPIFL